MQGIMSEVVPKKSWVNQLPFSGPAPCRVMGHHAPFLAAVLFACVGGAFDFSWGLIELRPGGLGSIVHAVQAWGASNAAFLVASLVLVALAWIPIRAIPVRMLDREGVDLLWYVLFLFLGTFLIFGTLAFGLAAILAPSVLTLTFWRSMTPVWALRIVATFMFCIILSWLSFSVMRRLSSDKVRTRAVVLAYLLPPITAASVALCWMHLFVVRYSRSLVNLSLSLFFLFAVMLLASVSIARLSRLVSPVMYAVGWVSFPILATVLLSIATPLTAIQDPISVSGAEPTRNVILISIDSLRWDSVSFLYPQASRTEAFDQLAKDSVVFRSAYSCSPWTAPAMGAALSGLSPCAYGVPTRPGRIPDGVSMLAERLRNSGFRTAAFVSGEWFTKGLGFDAGFDEYSAFPVSFGRSAGVRILTHWFPTRYGGRPSTAELFEFGLHWLENDPQRSKFLWMHILDPHTPYEPPDEYLPQNGRGEPTFSDTDAARLGKTARKASERIWIRNLYDGEVRDVDSRLGSFLDRLRARDLYEHSLIVLLSDHGEEFWDHGDFWHGHALTGDQIRVPLIIKLPGSAARKTIDDPVSTGSVAATILEISDVAFDAPTMTFASLCRHWAQQDSQSEKFPPASMGLFSGLPERSIVLGDVKYVYEIESGIEKWFSLVPDELAAIPIEQPPAPILARARQWRMSLEAHENEIRALLGSGNDSEVQLDEESRRRLKSLGYLQ